MEKEAEGETVRVGNIGLRRRLRDRETVRVGNIGWRRRLRERDCESWEYWREKEAEGERM